MGGFLGRRSTVRSRIANSKFTYFECSELRGGASPKALPRKAPQLKYVEYKERIFIFHLIGYAKYDTKYQIIEHESGNHSWDQ